MTAEYEGVERFSAEWLCRPCTAGPDRPSHGGSTPTRGRFTLADCAGAATDVLDHLGVVDPVHWVMLHRPSLLPVLSVIRAPILFITGDQDPLLDGEDSQRAAGLLPQGSSATIPGGGTSPHSSRRRRGSSS